MDEEQQILTKNYKRLPVDLQQVVRSIVQNGKLSQVLTRYKIPKEQLEAITEETLLVLLGIEHMSNYELNLKSVPSLDSDLASTIAGHIHMEIFRPVDESLEEIGEIQKTIMGETGSSAPEKGGGAMSQSMRSYASMWFVSRERQNVANQVRGKLDKTERLIKQVQSFGRAPSNNPPQTLNQ